MLLDKVYLFFGGGVRVSQFIPEYTVIRTRRKILEFIQCLAENKSLFLII